VGGGRGGGLLPSGTFPLERVRYFEKWNGHSNEHFILFFSHDTNTLSVSVGYHKKQRNNIFVGA